MNEAMAARAFDVVDEADFEERVLRRSSAVPVVVDFWAAWCAPCRALGPVLEREVAALDGRVELAKVDTERNPALAARYQIRSIPAVKAFRGGRVADEFVGALPAATVRAFLQALAPSAAAQALTRAEAARAAGDLDGAERELSALLAADPDRATGSQARQLLAGILLQRGRVDEAERAIAGADERADGEQLEALREAIALARAAAAYGGEAAARAALARDPDDLEARFALAGALAARGAWADALAEYLDIVGRSRKFRDDAARRAMLSLFAQPGIDPDLVRDFRRRLQIVT